MSADRTPSASPPDVPRVGRAARQLRLLMAFELRRNYRRTTRGLRRKFAKTLSLGALYAIWNTLIVLVAASNTALLCKKLQWDDRGGETLKVATLLLLLGCIGGGLAQGARDGSKGRSRPWLLLLPIERLALAASRFFSAGLGRPMLWLVVFPATLTLAWMRGRGLASAPAALATTLGVGVTLGTIAVATAFGLGRLPLSAERVARTLAAILGYACLIVSGLSLVGLLYDPVLALVTQIPGGALSSVASALFLQDLRGTAAALAVLLFTGTLGLSLASYEPALHAPRTSGAPRRRTARLRWVVTTELALLWADPLELAQMTAPALLVSGVGCALYVQGAAAGALQALLAPSALGVALYAASAVAVQCAVRKPDRLWLLYQLPSDMGATLARRALAGVPVGVVVASPLLLPALLTSSRPVLLAGWFLAALSLSCLLVGGLGVLASRPCEPEAGRRLRSLPSALALSAPYILAMPSVTRAAALAGLTMTLFALWTWAVWRRAERHLPGLLDPSEPELPGVRLSPLAWVGGGLAGLCVWAAGSSLGLRPLESGVLALPAAAAVASGLVRRRVERTQPS